MFNLVELCDDLQRINLVYQDDLVRALQRKNAPSRVIETFAKFPQAKWTNAEVIQGLQNLFPHKELVLEPPSFLLKG